MNKSSEYGKITEIEEVSDFETRPVGTLNGSNGSQKGMSQMINALFGGYSSMDGYRVKTQNTEVLVLIDNGQSCCESWGYFSSEDDLNFFVNAELLDIELTDTALNVTSVEKSNYYEDEGGIQFVTFKTDKGAFQLAVYNSHNGYYGHGIVVAIGERVVCEDTL